MTVVRKGLGFAVLIVAVGVSAQPTRSVGVYGDAAKGQFGDPAQGHFGDPSQGEFRRYNFNRAQEGNVPVLPGTPIDRFTAVPPPPRLSATEEAPRRNEVEAPYVMLNRPVD